MKSKSLRNILIGALVLTLGSACVHQPAGLNWLDRNVNITKQIYTQMQERYSCVSVFTNYTAYLELKKEGIPVEAGNTEYNDSAVADRYFLDCFSLGERQTLTDEQKREISDRLEFALVHETDTALVFDPENKR